jgi:hypothetical protein
MCERGGYIARLNYIDIKNMLDRRKVSNKEGTLTEGEIKLLVRKWQHRRAEEEMNHVTVEMEMRAMEKKLAKYNVARLGDIPLERDDGTMRVLVSQMGGCASREIR